MQNEKKVILSVEDLVIQLLETKTNIYYGNFDIELDDFVIIKGNNGSGKSTFLKIFAPTRAVSYCGHVRGKMFYRDGELRDKDIFSGGYDRASLLRTVVNITQEEKFSSWASAMTAMLQPTLVAIDEDRGFTTLQKQQKKREARVRAEYYFRDVLRATNSFTCSLHSFKYKKATSFSGGQQKMLNLISGIIKAEVMGAKLILMDEPLNNLDAKNKALFSAIIEKMRKERREAGNPIAIMAITHCQIFEGINKVITITPNPAAHKNTVVCERRLMDYHKECLEDFKITL
ncbi:MAG: ATP-binding cassette domain-containing protein [Clostridia bacterium]|nr:ATP-binding cassette domain-containing protein [Clostridia bacterium]